MADRPLVLLLDLSTRESCREAVNQLAGLPEEVYAENEQLKAQLEANPPTVRGFLP